MKIATWNVNSVRARVPQFVAWLRQQQPDVVCIQETKVQDLFFPREPLEDEGYNLEIHGEPNYNGVATLARFPITEVVKGFPEEPPDAPRRLLGCRVNDLLVINVYVPNGQALGHEKYRQKLLWLEQLRGFLDAHVRPDDKILMTGDFNITIDDRDVWAPDLLRGTIHCSEPERRALANVMAFGLVDALRRFHEQPGIYTWWDYRAGNFERERGLRIDHMLMSPRALETCREVTVDEGPRHGKGASDHAPVLALMDG